MVMSGSEAGSEQGFSDIDQNHGNEGRGQNLLATKLI